MSFFSHTLADSPVWQWGLVVGWAVIVMVIGTKLEGNDHVMSARQAVRASIAYNVVGALTGVAFAQIHGHGKGYMAIFIAEYGLNIDNLFIFIVLFGALSILPIYQRRVLQYGIYGAIIIRLALIAAGNVAEKFSVVMLFLGFMLMRTAYKTLRTANDEDTDITKHWAYRFVRWFMPVALGPNHGHSFFVKKAVRGKMRSAVTALGICLFVSILMDGALGLDSIATALGLDSDPLTIFAAMIFSMLGLRPLYFVLLSLKQKLTRLDWGVAAMVFWIGCSIWIGLTLAVDITEGNFRFALHLPGIEIPIEIEMIIILSVLLLSWLASWLIPDKEAIEEARKNEANILTITMRKLTLSRNPLGLVPVTMFVPVTEGPQAVDSMADEARVGTLRVAEGFVESLVKQLDENGTVDRIPYLEDFEGAIRAALSSSRPEQGSLSVVMSDCQTISSGGRENIVDMLSQLGSNDKVLVVRVDDQDADDPELARWLEWLDDASSVHDRVTVRFTSELVGSGLDELLGWFNESLRKHLVTA